MKKILLIAAAAAVTLFASCSKDDNNTGNTEMTKVTVKISGVIKSTGSRAIEEPGSDALGTIQLTNNSHIFVINPLGIVTYKEALNVANATGAGQVLAQPVATNSRVYIVGNYAAGFDPATLSTFDAIKTATSAMTTQSDYTEAALANIDGQPAAITVGADEATVNVSIKPLISRLELVSVRGGSDAIGEITAFTVTGVYVDDYYPSFTYVGGNSGTMFTQGQSTTFAGIGDADSWIAAGTPLVASPDLGNDELWAHNVASGGVPRFIIELDGVKYKPAAGDVVELTGKHYLTVTGYNGVTAFERGKIYRIGTDTNPFTFGPEDIDVTPNPEEIDLRVNVKIIEWEIVYPTAEL